MDLPPKLCIFLWGTPISRQACRRPVLPPLGKGDATLRIGRAIAPTAAQEPLLQKLGTALAQANGYLIKSCPAVIPPLPVERLELSIHRSTR